MAAELVGGALLSASLDLLFERILSEVGVGKKLDGLLKKLKIKLWSVNAVINDAEEKQFRDPSVKEWLHEHKDAVHDAEDLLGEIANEALGRKLEAESGSRKRKVRDFISNSLNLFEREMVPKVEKILDRLEEIEKGIDAFGLKKGTGEKLSERILTTSLVDESDNVYGRNDDREAIIKSLLSDDDVSGSKICVIPIVGMGGIGKTTLARLVYNDRRVEEHFDLQAWVCVAEECDVLRVTKTVLKAIPSHSQEDIDDLNLLQVELKEKLREKKFLFVLDDVWNHDYWEVLKIPFTFGKQGSKIIVTTRDQRVGSVMGTVPIHTPSVLSDEDCWLIFEKHAFGNQKFGAHPTLEAIGKDIVEKCGGLPLALKSLGSLLSFKLDIEEWYKILNSEIWEISNDKILPALKLSYCYLPLHLKQCFAYCSMFPKDYEFEKEELIQLWMAEGLLDFSKINKRNKRMEEVGEEYFDELVSRSFFQWLSGEESYFVMHDLVHDLAEFVSGEFGFMVEDDSSDHISEKTRHLPFLPDPSLKLETIHNAKCLRTFLLPWLYGNRLFDKFDKLSVDLILKLRYLRVLCLSYYMNLRELPDSIGTLKHLRYLDLSHNSIVRLPECVSTLYNLQTLKLSYCYCLKKLPMDFHKLINLRYLDITGCARLEEMPSHMSRLKSLQMLSNFIVGNENGVKIGELGQLSNLRGELHIKKLRKAVNAEDASEAKLKYKRYIQKLHLEYGYDNNVGTRDSLIETVVLEKLQPHTNLKELKIENYRGTKFPYWLGDQSFYNMVSLSLQNCKNCCNLPSLGQLPSLKVLYINGFNAVHMVGPEFYGNGSFVTKPFPSLESLSFNCMNAWHEWCCFGVEDEEGRAFPLLRELYIKNCQSLTGSLPQNLPSLTKLVICDCKQLVSSLPRAPAICELELARCEKLGLQELITYSKSCLQHFRISDCSSFVSFPGDCLPTTLKTLKILECKKFRFPVQQYHTSLEQLTIGNISDTLNSLPLDNFPNLNQLSIVQDNFVSFPIGGSHASNLTSLSVSGCDKLKSLPERMHILLPSLEYLDISYCPELDSFPEGGLPSNLSSLTIRHGCDKLIARRVAWHLQSLHSLTHFTIFCENVEPFPEEGLLPSTLIWLSMSISCLKTLDNRGLQHLTSLDSLFILNCPNLQSMPQEGLPSSLTSLQIYGCHLLKERCQKENGEDWPKIAHIPYIRIDNRTI